MQTVRSILKDHNVDSIWSSSQARLSKYHATTSESSPRIYVIDQYDKWDKPTPINQATQIFEKYEGARVIDRVYCRLTIEREAILNAFYRTLIKSF